MPNNLPYSTTYLTDNLQERWEFIKIDFPSPVGTLRFTNRPEGYTGNIDGTVQTWVEYGFSHSPISQTLTDLYSTAWVSFPNIHNDWDNYNYQVGVRNVVITLYLGRFNISTGLLAGARQIFRGRMDDGEFGEEAKINLKPYINPLQESPYGKIGGRCTNDFMNPLDCQYPYTAGLTCAKTREACRGYGNEININIYDDLPGPREMMMYGGANHGLITKDE